MDFGLLFAAWRRGPWYVHAAGLGLLSVLAGWALAQASARDDAQAYPLRHVQAERVESRLRELLADVPGSEVAADSGQNRLIVRGPAEAQRIARQLVAALDRSPATEESELRAYPYGGEDLADRVERLRAAYAGNASVRIAVDARTSQVLVMAPAGIHEQIAGELGSRGNAPTVQAAPGASTPSVAQPAATPSRRTGTRRTVQLTRLRWGDLEPRLKGLWGERFQALGETAEAGRYAVTARGGGEVALDVAWTSGQVTLSGDRALVARCALLLETLDAPAQDGRRRTQVLPLRNVDPARMRLVADAVGRNEPADGARAVRRAAPAAEGGRPAARVPAPRLAQNQPPVDGQPPQEEQPQDAFPQDQLPEAFQPDMQDEEQPPERTVVLPPQGGLIGSVQIEYLAEYDILIIRGLEQDVEKVMEIISQIEEQSAVTQPEIVVHDLEHVGSEALSAIITQLYDQVLAGRQGRVSITALAKPNALLLIGRKEAVDAVIELVERLDVPVEPSGQFQVFRLRYAAAAEAQATITQFFAERTALGPRVLVIADFRSNSLVVQASPRDLVEVGNLLDQLDTPDNEAVNEMRVFQLTNSLATDLAPILQDAITAQPGAAGQAGIAALQQPAAQPGQPGAAAAGQAQPKSTMLRLITIDADGQRQLSSGILTDVRITADARANALLVSASAESMELIAALIAQLDQAPSAVSEIKVFTIVNGDAAALVTMLETLFARQAIAGGGGGGGLFGQAGGQQAAGGPSENPLIDLRFTVDTRTNSIIASGSAGDLAVVEAILFRLDSSDVRERENIVYRLKNTYSVIVADAINQFLDDQREVQNIQPESLSAFQQLEREVVVVPEEISNSLIVSATPRYFEEIKKIVEQLDARPPMVMIQVVIAEVELNNTDEFGVELGLQDSILFDRSLVGDLVTTTTSTTFGDPPTTVQEDTIQAATLLPGYSFNNQPLGNSGSDKSLANGQETAGQALTNFSVGRINGELGYGGLVLSAGSENVSILIRALQDRRRVEILQRPQVMTLDNQPAFIQVGNRVPRVTGVQINETGQVNNVVDENVGLILGVTPRISPEGLVVMEIDAENSAVGPEDEGVPISISATGEVVRQPLINITLAQTTVSAMDGQTVVLGGLITNTKASVSRRVPWLSEIPVLGNLFRYDSVQSNRSELLIIMTPRIVRNQRDAENIRQVESARMSWCIADVRRIHGGYGPLGLGDQESGMETTVIYPDENPTGLPIELLPPGEGPTLAPAQSESAPRLPSPDELPESVPQTLPPEAEEPFEMPVPPPPPEAGGMRERPREVLPANYEYAPPRTRR